MNHFNFIFCNQVIFIFFSDVISFFLGVPGNVSRFCVVYVYEVNKPKTQNHEYIGGSNYNHVDWIRIHLPTAKQVE